MMFKQYHTLAIAKRSSRSEGLPHFRVTLVHFRGPKIGRSSLLTDHYVLGKCSIKVDDYPSHLCFNRCVHPVHPVWVPLLKWQVVLDKLIISENNMTCDYCL